MKNFVDESYKIFRVLTFVCLAVIVIFAALYYFSLISDKGFAISSGVVALLAGVFGIFANKPPDGWESARFLGFSELVQFSAS